MIDRIIDFSIKNKAIIGFFTLVLVGWGIYSLTRLPIDAVPDITNNQVQIISWAPTLAPQEVEQFVTAPIEVAVANLPDIIELRSISRLGLSVVTVVFKEHVDIYKARQLIGERLDEAERQIPPGVAEPEFAPVSSGLGEIYQYTLNVRPGYENKYTPMELRTVQDWIVRRAMLGTPGVADVNSYGGFLKQYEVSVQPERLRSMNLTLTDIFEALEKNNENTGGAYIDKKPNAYFIRGIGLASSLEDIEKIVVKNQQGIPVLVRDVAQVKLGHAIRFGAFVSDTTGEAVGGVVMMLKGANAHEVIDNVKKRLAVIEESLPEGVYIKPYLDRTDLVSRAIDTVSRNLAEGGLIVVFVLVLLLGNMRAGLIVASVIPLSMLFAISLMNVFGISGNLMSLGAIDFGLIVDGAVIIVESVTHQIFVNKQQYQDASRLTRLQMDTAVYTSAKRMMGAAIYGQIIILIVYLPILALVGIEGKMFRPMAQVVSFAILGAIILSLTYVPVVSALFLGRNTEHKPNISDKLMAYIQKGFDPLIHLALRKKLTVAMVSLFLFIGSIWLFSRLGGEFLPELEEGDLAAGVMTLQGSSLTNTVETVTKANKIMLTGFPEIKQAVCKIGAGEIPTDPTPMETGDYIITLKDKSEWTTASTREELVEKLEEKLSVLAGVVFEFQQPIQMRFNELMTGAKQDVAVKIFGDNLDLLAANAAKAATLIQHIDGVEDINVEKVTGLPQIQVEYNRDKIAAYGLNISDINRILKTAFAGSSAGVIYDEEKRFDLVVRLDKDYRRDIEDVKNLYIPIPAGGQINLDQVADVQIKEGPAQISREDTKRRITIGFNVRGRDVESVVDEVRAKIGNTIKLPAGYYVTYGGQFENLVAAKKRLSIAVPIALSLIFILLYFTFRSIKESLLIFSAVPLSAIGGVIALWIRGMHFSTPAGIGFIALFGVAVLNGIVLIAEFNRLEREGMSDIYERVIKGLKDRLRPVIMTAAVASLGFLPMALSTSAGAEVQKPLATVVIGGLITSTLLTLVVLPALYVVFSKKRKSDISVHPGVVMFFLGCTLFMPLHGQAQEASPRVITLQQAIQHAVDSNFTITSAFYKVQKNRVLKGMSWDLGKTSIDFEYGQSNSSEKDNSFVVSQSFSFPSVYARQNRLAMARLKASEAEFSITRNEVIYRIKSTWWRLAYFYSKLRLLQYEDSLYSNFLRAAERKVQTGEANSLEKIDAEAQCLEIKNLVQQTMADIDIGCHTLQVLLNTSNPVVIADTVLRKLDIPFVAEDNAIKDNPTRAYYEQQSEVARMEAKVEGAGLYPDFTIGYFNKSIIGSYEDNGTTRYFSASDRFTGIQAGISIPLWFVPQASKAKAARIGEQIARADAAAFQQELSGKYHEQVQEYRKYRASVTYYEQLAVPKADMIIGQLFKSYKAGALDYAEYIQGLSRALQIKNNYLETLNQYNQTIIEIEYLMGIKNN